MRGCQRIVREYIVWVTVHLIMASVCLTNIYMSNLCKLPYMGGGAPGSGLYVPLRYRDNIIIVYYGHSVPSEYIYESCLYITTPG